MIRYINNDATDETTAPDLYFFKPLNMAYQLISANSR